MLKIKNYWLVLKTRLKRMPQIFYRASFKRCLKTFFQNLFKLRFSARLIGGLFLILLVGVIGILLLKNNDPGLQSFWRLENSWTKEKVCHEECLNRRAKDKEIISKSLAEGSRQMNKKVQKYLFQSGSNISLEFQIELVKIIADALGQNNPPAYLREAVINNKIAASLQIATLNNFQIFRDNQEARHFYLSILNSERDLVLKKEAVRALSNLNGRTKEGKELMAETDFGPLENLLFDFKTPLSLRISVVMLLSDYYYLFPERSVEVLTKVYETTEFDNFSRALAAETLNRFAPAVSYELPTINENDWQQYYNN